MPLINTDAMNRGRPKNCGSGYSTTTPRGRGPASRPLGYSPNHRHLHPHSPIGEVEGHSNERICRSKDEKPSSAVWEASNGKLESPSVSQPSQVLTGGVCRGGNVTEDGNSQLLESKAAGNKFDICPPRTNTGVKLKPSLLEINREKKNEIKRSAGGSKGAVLRDGMVLLKNYISSSDQAEIVKICRELGLGDGGFYQPGYRDGAKLHLKMMCLGMNWDPEERKYGEFRPVDGAKPPSIPTKFQHLVERAINDSHFLIAEKIGAGKVEDVLPSMTPDICLVNFYPATGKLGLHQDRDESKESLRRGLPVVSFSIGNTAEFLYGDDREVEDAEKVELESGDVLIFGGRSRHIFHGVSTIIPDTAPKSLLKETNMRSGRLNLTFRQY